MTFEEKIDILKLLGFKISHSEDYLDIWHPVEGLKPDVMMGIGQRVFDIRRNEFSLETFIEEFAEDRKKSGEESVSY